MIECYEDYVQQCNMLQLSMNEQKRGKMQSIREDKETVCLNIWEVTAILELGHEITNAKKNCSNGEQELTEKKAALYEKIKEIKFLANKNEEDRLKFVHDL